MPDAPPLLRVRPARDGVGWQGWCGHHGWMPLAWVLQTGAAMDLLGHAAHHHAARRPPTDGARCWWCPRPAAGYRDTRDGAAVAVCEAHLLIR